MATIEGNLWEHNLVRVVIVDVTDDYRLMQPPMPSEFYPVLEEMWLPSYRISERLPVDNLLSGYLYDWHEMPLGRHGNWYVGMVKAELTQEPAFRSLFEAMG